MVWKNANTKQKLVLVIGILYSLNIITNNIFNYVHSAPLLYIISTHVQYACMITAMILITYRKKTPALVLTILAVVICLVNQYVLTYGSVDPFYRTLYYMLEYILLIAYILIRDDRQRDSLAWCGIFIFAVGYSVYEIAKFLTVKDLVFLINYLVFYLVGYSPDKWYNRGKTRESTGTQKA